MSRLWGCDAIPNYSYLSFRARIRLPSMRRCFRGWRLQAVVPPRGHGEEGIPPGAVTRMSLRKGICRDENPSREQGTGKPSRAQLL